MKQTVGNACGTIGVFHAIMNNREDVLTNQNEEDEEENKNYFRRFFEKTKDMTPDERVAEIVQNGWVGFQREPFRRRFV